VQLSNILHIETSHRQGSVAITHGAESFEMICYENDHIAKLPQLIEEALLELRISFKELDAIAVSSGPGSYTGLRVGVGLAKGYSLALGLPLIAIETLQCMAELEYKLQGSDGIYISMLDAGRLEVYQSIYRRIADEWQLIQTSIPVDYDNEQHYNLLQSFDNEQVIIFGNGCEKLKVKLETYHIQARFNYNNLPAANAMISLAREKYIVGEFVDVAYFEPRYLKEFTASKPSRKWADLLKRS